MKKFNHLKDPDQCQEFRFLQKKRKVILKTLNSLIKEKIVNINMEDPHNRILIEKIIRNEKLVKIN